MKKEDLKNIESNINNLLDMFFDYQKKGNNTKAHQTVDRITYEMKKLRTEEEKQIGKETYLH
jgi:hypothetical protein